MILDEGHRLHLNGDSGGGSGGDGEHVGRGLEVVEQGFEDERLLNPHLHLLIVVVLHHTPHLGLHAPVI